MKMLHRNSTNAGRDKLFRYLLPLGLLFSLAPSWTFAGLLNFDLNTVADSFIQANSADTNYGTDSRLLIKNDGLSTNATRHAYIKFDTSSLGSDTVTGATFSIDFTNGSASTPTFKEWNFSIYGLNNSGSNDAWTETGITFNNAPGNAAGNAVNPAQTTLLGEFNIIGTGVGVTFDLSGTSLIDFLNADTNGSVSFMVVRNTAATSLDTNYIHALASRDSAVGPRLAVTVSHLDAASGIPAPTPIALMGFALAGLWIRSKRPRTL